MGYIYELENVINHKKYVGQTKDPKMRWKHHKTDHLHGGTTELDKAFQEFGSDNFTFKIIEECNDDEMSERERYWIQKLNTYIYDDGSNGYNMTRGGRACFGDENPFYGKTHNEETKKMLSEKASNRRGCLNPFYGKHHSDKTKELISAANTGNKWSEDRKEKFSKNQSGTGNYFYGKRHTDEAKKKMSEYRKGKVPPTTHPWFALDENGKKVICFLSIGKVLEWINNKRENKMTMPSLRGRLKTAQKNKTKFMGYYWERSVETIENTNIDLEVSRVGFEMNAEPKREDVI